MASEKLHQNALRKEIRLNSSKDNFIAESSRLCTKMNLSTLLNFLFPLVSFIGVFSILKCKTLVLKTTTWHLLRCQIHRLLPHPLWGCPSDFCGGGGMGDLVRARIFFPNLWSWKFFSLTYNGVRFFSALYTSWGNFFSGQDIFFPRYILASFSPSKSVYRTFFLKSLITSSKVKLSAAKIHQTLAQ